jgi:hypothetical protein
MAIAVDTLIDISYDLDDPLERAFFQLPENIVNWLTTNVGELTSSKWVPLNTTHRVQEYFGNGWTVRAVSYPDKWGGYWLHLDEMLELQFKLTWL